MYNENAYRADDLNAYLPEMPEWVVKNNAILFSQMVEHVDITITTTDNKDYMEKLSCDNDEFYGYTKLYGVKSRDAAGNYGLFLYLGYDYELFGINAVEKNYDFFSSNSKNNNRINLPSTSAEIGLTKIGGNYQGNLNWSISAVNGEFSAGIDPKTIVGFSSGGQLIQGTLSFEIPLIEIMGKHIQIDIDGNLIGIGGNLAFEEGRFKVGATCGIGGSVAIGLD